MIQEKKLIDFGVILWDFDGVILDSLSIKNKGFRHIFSDYPSHQVDALINYHELNGGISRYQKIRYFYKHILEKKISEVRVMEYANVFSVMMKHALIDKKYLIMDSIDFIKDTYKDHAFHIVSGSDQTELRYLSKVLKVEQYFISIHGSPTSKYKLINQLLTQYQYSKDEVCLVGDAINDAYAADENGIKFFAYNNPTLKENFTYIDSFYDL